MGVIQNEQEGERLRSTAIKIFKDEADSGNKEAISKLGRILADGSQLNNINFIEELKWLKLASKNGCSEASFMLGNIYNIGDKRNETE